jgi:putative ABC transport system ATP-binding protein
MITLANVSKRYPNASSSPAALDGVDLTIERGEFVAVTGPAGSGKTTMLNIVGLIDTPSAGRYLFGGEDLSNRSVDELADLRRRHVGFIFQTFHLLADLTVSENVELPLHYQDVPHALWRTRVREVLELVGLDTRGKEFLDDLSIGEQQLVAIARALVNAPPLIVADEPTSSLDGRNEAEVLEMLATLHREGATVLMVTHSPARAALAERIVHLRDGRIVPAARI